MSDQPTFTAEQLVTAEKLKNSLSRSFAENSREYVMPPTLCLECADGTSAVVEFPGGPDEVLEEWAYTTVGEHRAVRAILLYSNWMPGRRTDPGWLDVDEFDRFVNDGGNPDEWPGSVDVLIATVLKAGEPPWAVYGYLQRNTTPVTIDWEPDPTYTSAPVIEAIACALEKVQTVFDVVALALAGITGR
jgi:hypothetical protein